MSVLRVSEREWRLLLSHMADVHERAAFMLAHPGHDALTVFDVRYLTDAEVDSGSDHLVLADDVRSKMIAWAWRSRACLVECHSHPEGAAAAFSLTDLDGLAEWVPHARWRLSGAPYVALVHAPHSFDALAWTDATGLGSPLEHVLVGPRTLAPTGLTYRYLQEHSA
jgi:hypothetical protein